MNETRSTLNQINIEIITEYSPFSRNPDQYSTNRLTDSWEEDGIETDLNQAANYIRAFHPGCRVSITTTLKSHWTNEPSAAKRLTVETTLSSIANPDFTAAIRRQVDYLAALHPTARVSAEIYGCSIQPTPPAQPTQEQPTAPTRNHYRSALESPSALDLSPEAIESIRQIEAQAEAEAIDRAQAEADAEWIEEIEADAAAADAARDPIQEQPARHGIRSIVIFTWLNEIVTFRNPGGVIATRKLDSLTQATCSRLSYLTCNTVEYNTTLSTAPEGKFNAHIHRNS